MNNIQAFNSKQDIQQQACEWVSRFDRGLRSDEEQDFSKWINTSKTHQKCLFEAAQTWDDLSVLHELSGLSPIKDKHVSQRKVFSYKTRVAIAASFAFMVISCLALIINTQLIYSAADSSLLVFETRTSIGENRALTLVDGSVIHLNTDSVVSVDFSDTRRDVTLLRGEAHFEVAHDEQRPFVVKAGDNTVTAVGTAFNVQITNAHQLELLVTDGKVLIKNKQQSNPISPVSEFSHPLDSDGELMVAGQKALINQKSIQQLNLSYEQVQTDLAWQQGMLVFHGEPLAEALQEISRYTSIRFTLADEQVKQRRVAGYFKAGDIQGLLFALENNFNIVYDKLDEQTIVLSSGS
jgi:transmembrane sensor